MKKTVLLFFIFIVFSISYSIDLDVVKETYLNFIDVYSEGYTSEAGKLDPFFEELNNLGLYRFYRTQMIGSAEYVDRPTNVQTYLSQIFDNIEDQFETIEEKLAFAGFLAYVQSDLSGDALTREKIRSLPAYFRTVQDHKKELENNALTYFGNVIIYSLGIEDEAPFTNIKRFETTGQILDRRFYIYEDEPNEEFNLIIEENLEDLEKGIEELAVSGVTGRQLQIAIDQLSYRYVNSLIKETDDQINQIIQIFINEGKRGNNISFIRFVVYGLLILLSFYFIKKYLWIITLGIFGFELFYLFAFFDPIKDTISGFFYGSYIVTFVFLFLAVLFFKSFGKKIFYVEKIINFSIFVLIILLLFIPSYFSYDLLMKENPDFHLSQFQYQLLNDTVVYPHSFLNRNISSLISYLGREYSSANTFYRSTFGGFLRNIINTEVLSQVQGSNVQTNRNGLKINNIDNYRGYPEQFSKNIENFIKTSEMNQRNIKNELNSMETNIENVIKFSDSVFETKFISESNKLLLSTDLTEPLLSEINTFYDVDKENAVKLRPYNTLYGNKILILFFLSITIFIIYEQKIAKYLATALMYLSGVLSLVKVTPLEVISQYGYPTIFTSDYKINMLFGIILFLVTTLLVIRQFLFLNKKSNQ